MPYCHNCGLEVEQEERFCAKCGSPQEIVILQKQQREVPRSRKSSALLLSLLLIITLIFGSIAAFFVLSDNSYIIYDINATIKVIQKWGKRQEKSDPLLIKPV